MAHGGGQLEGGALQATVGERFELLFKLTGPDERKVRVELSSTTLGEALQPLALTERFSVSPPPKPRGAAEAPKDEAPAPPTPRPAQSDDWLQQIEPSVREAFAHLAAHGAVTEEEVSRMLGGPRAARRFALNFERYASAAAFDVRVESVGGMKRYVREGGHR